MRTIFTAIALTLLVVTAQPAFSSPVTDIKQPAKDALQEAITKIAKSYSKDEWKYSLSSMEAGRIDSDWSALNRKDVYCVTIDPMIPTYTDWKIGNFVVYNEEGNLWVAEEAQKDLFMRLSCNNWKDPV